MKSVNVKDAIDRAPFKPLIIAIDNGQQFKIPHREFIQLSPGGNTAVIFQDEHVHIVDVEHISTIAIERGKKKTH